MSKYINEIIKDIKENPTSWKDFEGNGLSKGEIIISSFGNGAVLSIIYVYINNKDMPTTYIDRFKLERTIGKWYRSVKLETIVKP